MRAAIVVLAVLTASHAVTEAEPPAARDPQNAAMLTAVDSAVGPAAMLAAVSRVADPNDPLTAALLGGGAAMYVLGPSAGRWYAGNQGLAVRLGAAFAIGFGAWRHEPVPDYVGRIVDVASSAVRAHHRRLWITPTAGGLVVGGAF